MVERDPEIFVLELDQVDKTGGSFGSPELALEAVCESGTKSRMSKNFDAAFRELHLSYYIHFNLAGDEGSYRP